MVDVYAPKAPGAAPAKVTTVTAAKKV
jgi:hypothetical protein